MWPVMLLMGLPSGLLLVAMWHWGSRLHPPPPGYRGMFYPVALAVAAVVANVTLQTASALPTQGDGAIYVPFMALGGSLVVSALTLSVMLQLQDRRRKSGATDRPPSLLSGIALSAFTVVAVGLPVALMRVF